MLWELLWKGGLPNLKASTSGFTLVTCPCMQVYRCSSTLCSTVSVGKKCVHRCLCDHVRHVVYERAQHKQRPLRGQDLQCLITLDANLQMLFEGPMGSLLLQPYAAWPHINLCLRPNEEHLNARLILELMPQCLSL